MNLLKRKKAVDQEEYDVKEKYQVIHYINQFFAGYGGEEKAQMPIKFVYGPLGPGKGLIAAAKDRLDIITTIICGDNYFHSNQEKVLNEIENMVKAKMPELVVAGPSFNAGRYGLACRQVCERIEKCLNIPTLTAMNVQNPGATAKPIGTYILPCGESVRDMNAILPVLAAFSLKLCSGEEIKDPKSEGYIPRGIRKNEFLKNSAAVRAAAILKRKIYGESFETEIPLPVYDKVEPPAPVSDLAKATIAIVTDGGVVPKGNPDRLESARSTKWLKYDIAGLDRLDSLTYESVHGGFDLAAVNKDPNRIVPVDGLRKLEKERKIGKLYEAFYTTSGMTTPVVDCTRLGKEMAADLSVSGVDGVILTGT